MLSEVYKAMLDGFVVESKHFSSEVFCNQVFIFHSKQIAILKLYVEYKINYTAALWVCRYHVLFFSVSNSDITSYLEISKSSRPIEIYKKY